MSADEKPLRWMGASYQELTSFPNEARREAGHALGELQLGAMPDDWKPMEGVGAGACEIRIRITDGGVTQHRVIYVAKFAEAVYVLHAFNKKTEKTSPHNLQVARRRYREIGAQRESLIQRRKGNHGC
jgi:phage-related protein